MIPELRLDGLIPSPEFSEFHSKVIAAPVEAVWRSFVDLPAGDLQVTQALMALRSAPLRLAGKQASDSGGTFLETAPLPLLYVVDESYALSGGVGRPWSASGSPADVVTYGDVRDFDEPGWAKIATDFWFHPLGERTLVTTETRVRTTDPSSYRKMSLYWSAIRIFSGVVRRDILRAVERNTAQLVPD